MSGDTRFHPCRHSLDGGTLEMVRVPQVLLGDEFYDRLINFYHKQPANLALSHIWEGIHNSFYTKLHEALDARDRASLRQVLDTIYDGNMLFGVDFGNTMTDQAQRWDNMLLRAAISVGVLNEYNPEQDNQEHRERNLLLVSMEQELGGRLGIVEGPMGWFGAQIQGRVVPHKLLEEAATYAHVKNWMKFQDITQVIELGGGTGNLAITFELLNPMLKNYWLVDLPLVAVLQGYILASVFAEEDVSLMDRSPERAIFMVRGLNWPDIKAQVIINKDSLPEIPRGDASEFVQKIRYSLKDGGAFFSFNHESHLDGQRRVYDLIQGVPMIQKVRAPFMSRPGYMLEIFTKP